MHQSDRLRADKHRRMLKKKRGKYKKRISRGETAEARERVVNRGGGMANLVIKLRRFAPRRRCWDWTSEKESGRRETDFAGLEKGNGARQSTVPISGIAKGEGPCIRKKTDPNGGVRG